MASGAARSLRCVALASQTQDDFSGGMYRGRKAPANALYDLVNGLINDEGLPFKRGGSTYKSGANSTAAIEGLIDGYVSAGQRTVFWSETAEDVYALDSNDSSVVSVSLANNTWRKFARGVVVGGVLWVPATKIAGSTSLLPLGYAGTRKTADAAAFSMTATNGSKTVTGAATSFLSTVDAGMFVERIGGVDLGVGGIVRSVTSDTSLELVSAWPLITATTTGQITRFASPAALLDSLSTDPVYVATAGQRLIAAQGSRVNFTQRGGGLAGANSGIVDYHQLPEAALITGAASINDIALIFTTAGVWGISNMVLDPIDDFGNFQHTVEQVNRDLILWGDPGIAAWSGVLVVPAVDDVYLFGPGSPPVPITGPRADTDASIRNLYRSYVTAGYQPGMASLHRGHYFLPIMNGTTVVDVLVCRLDRGFAWTRWSGHATGGAYAQRVGSSTRSPKLLGINGQRVTDLTGCFDPVAGNSADADATIPSLTIITRDYPLSNGNQHGFCQRIRVRAEVTDDANGATAAAAATVEYSSDADGGTFTALTATGEQDGAAGWTTSTGAKYWWALVGKRRERIRFRLTFSGGTASTILREITLLLRPSGRQ